MGRLAGAAPGGEGKGKRNGKERMEVVFPLKSDPNGWVFSTLALKTG